MLAITLVYCWCKSGVATIKHQRKMLSVPNVRFGIVFQSPVTYLFVESTTYSVPVLLIDILVCTLATVLLG